MDQFSDTPSCSPLEPGEATVEEQEVKRTVRTAWVWSHYIVTPLDATYEDTGTKKVKKDHLIRCRHCRFTSSDSSRHNSTGNLTRHLMSRHRISNKNAKESSQGLRRIEAWAQATQSPQLRASEESDPDYKILRWVVSTMQPFTAVEEPTFQDMLGSDSGCQLKSATTLKRRIMHEFQLERAMLISALEIGCRTIALSLDAWTSANQLPFLAIIRHWVTQDFKYEERILEFIELEGMILVKVCL